MQDSDTNKNYLPYDKLTLLGMDHEAVDKLPRDIKQGLAEGGITPLVQVSITASNGMAITLPIKLQVIADKEGNPALIAYPVQRELMPDKGNELKLTSRELEALKRGDVLRRPVDIDGDKSQQYLQLDPQTKSVIHRPVTEIEIEKRLKDMEKVNDVELGTQQKQHAREGKPVELNLGGEKVTVGIDLKEPQGFRVVKGDMNEWERQKKMCYDEQHPEYLGLVMTDKNRWEYQKVVERDSKERAISFDPGKKERSSGLKI